MQVLIDENKLKAVVNANETSQNVMTYLSSRQRHRDLNLNHIKKTIRLEGGKINDVDYASFWARLAEIGCGSIIHTRGKGDYFKWDYNLKAVAELAVPSITAAPTNTNPIKKTILRKTTEMKHIDITTPSGMMTLILPQNHTKKDIQVAVNQLLKLMVE